jgi:hypothetical protein
VSTTTSCGQCGAPLRPDQGWCSLCYARVESGFDPLTAPLEELLERSEPVEEPEQPSEVTSASAALDHVYETSGDVAIATQQEDAQQEVTDVDVMLSMLAAEHRLNDPSAGLAERLGDRSTRITVMVGGTLLIAGVGFLVLTVLGAVL